MIGKKVRARREELGLTQKELADRMGYKSKSTINKIEMDINDVNQSTLSRLAFVLGVDELYFINNENQSSQRLLAYYHKMMKMSPDQFDKVASYIDYISDTRK